MLVFIIWTSQNLWILPIKNPCKYRVSVDWQSSTGLHENLIGTIWEFNLVLRIEPSRLTPEMQRLKSIVLELWFGAHPYQKLGLLELLMCKTFFGCLFQKRAKNILRPLCSSKHSHVLMLYVTHNSEIAAPFSPPPFFFTCLDPGEARDWESCSVYWWSSVPEAPPFCRMVLTAPAQVEDAARSRVLSYPSPLLSPHLCFGSCCVLQLPGR